MRHAKVDAAYAAQAVRQADAWQQALTAGRNPRLPGLADAPASTQLSAVTSLRNRLRFTASNAAAPATITAYNPNDPNTFAIRGSRGSRGLYWSGMVLIYEAQYCTSTCQVTDRYTANVTVNPGATTKRFNGSNLYFPDSGNFQNKHFKMWSVCQGSVCGSADTGNLPNASVDYLSGYGDRHGKVLTSAVTLWVYFAPRSAYESGWREDARRGLRSGRCRQCVSV